MKFNALVQLCKSSKQIVVYNEDQSGAQWISDGRAIYPLYNFPKLTRENIFRIMDVPEDKQDKFFYREGSLPKDVFSFEDMDPTENALETGKVGIETRGILFIPLKTQNGISFINYKHLSPFSDADNGYQLFERISKNGIIYIAVKIGFMLAGIVIPYTEILTKELASELNDIASNTTVAAVKKAYEGEEEQQGLFEEEEEK